MMYNQPIRKTFLACFLASLPLSGAIAAEPAIVSKLGGKNVLMEHAGKTELVQVQSLLSGGDRVSAGAGSYIEVEYLADGCTVRVSAGHSMDIGAASPCAASTKQAAAGDGKAAPKDGTAPAEARIVPAEAPPETVKVSDATGPVTRVSRGDGLADLKVGTELASGDAVFAGPDSTISLSLASGCQYVVPESTFYTIPAVAPCTPTGIVPAATEGTRPTAAVALTTTVFIGASAIALIASSDAFDDNENEGGSGVGGPGGPPATDD